MKNSFSFSKDEKQCTNCYNHFQKDNFRNAIETLGRNLKLEISNTFRDFNLLKMLIDYSNKNFETTWMVCNKQKATLLQNIRDVIADEFLKFWCCTQN